MKNLGYFSVVLIFIFFGCNNSYKKIEALLLSNETNDLILGSLKARRSGDERFCKFLIQNADDPRRSTNIRHKGVSVYQAKMEALKKILGEEPPKKIDQIPDSVNIKFYTELIKRRNI